MKKILNWVKAQWLIVLFLALVLIAVPCGFIFGRMWHSKILEEQAKLATDKRKAIDGTKVSYSVASPVPGVPGIDDKGEPNAKKTEFAEREQIVRFFAAGIVAENPQKFGLTKDRPLSELFRIAVN